MRRATSFEIEHWDELVAHNPDGGHILQSRAWGEFKRRHGWQPLYWLHEHGAHQTAVLVLQRHIPGLGNLWYAPKGPGVTQVDELGEIVDTLRDTRRSFAVKVEPELPEDAATDRALAERGLVKAQRDVQITRATIIVDLTPDEDALLASFKPKTRYNIRLAGRRGVTVEPVAADEANIDAMYELMRSTQSRAAFTLRPKDYFAGYWRLHEAAGQGQMFFARRNGEILAGLYATFIGCKSWYKDGGSTKSHAEVMAPHLLQWEAMRWLRARGIRSYDLVAVPPPGSLHEGHRLYGLYRFKSGFSDTISEFVGTWDAAASRRRYQIWQAVAEPLAHQWAYRVHHDLFY